ncbi:MAG: Lrp/AsnC ligand binding domain-containing protein [Candidatus Bathyarchaeota archaeon]
MISAFILVNVDMGAEEEVLKEVQKLPDVKEAYFVYGVHDIVAKVEGETVDTIRKNVFSKVRLMDKVRVTHTMIITEGFSR